MTKKSDVVIIGGGVSGLSIAYFLAKNGLNVTVLEKRYLGAGASGRNGGGVREQFSTRESIFLAKESINFFEKMSSIMGYNILFRQGGYQYLAYTEGAFEDMRNNVKIQNENGVKSRILSVEEIAEKYSYLDTSKIYGGAYNRRDGIVFPQAVVSAFAKGVKVHGGTVYTYTKADDIIMENGKIKGVKTDKGMFEADKVVAAAGAYTRDVARMVNVQIPTRPVRHEILATEPVKFYQIPMLVGVPSGIYFSQSMRGEIVGGIGDLNELEGYEVHSSLEFLKYFAREITKMIPSMKHVKVLRQWAGLYDMSHDVKPVLGETERENFYVACGYSGHGLMISPMVGKLVAQVIMNQKPDIDMKPFSLDRFKESKLELEKTMIG